jgi:serine/threonine protein kinase
MTVRTPDNEAIFHAARDIPDLDRRRAYVREACGTDEARVAHVAALLSAAEAPDSLLDRPAGSDPAAVHQPAESAGTVIGSYKLIEPIGAGGMGAVWMAQQTQPVKRVVALKLIKPGIISKQTVARFEAECQALALMDHANIAHVLEVGTTSAGGPYFVMDLVKGVPITRYCDEHRLTPRQRLELFIPVCQAVQHAHQKGVIHRDLKPSNVLVAPYDGRPVPKVIDFGVAKAAGESLTEKTLVTGFGAIIGTLEYMSPEQAELNNRDIDTRSDIYALGALLYELLAGTPPFTRTGSEAGGLLEMLRVIREQEPTKPSAMLSTAEGLPALAANRGTEPAKLANLVRGELDWIVMKALEKDRGRRYETADGFAQDVRRYLADEPVQARPPSAGYRLRKFVRRNQSGLAAALAFVLLMVTAVVTLTVALVAVNRERQEKVVALEAEGKRRKQARAAVEDLSSLLVEDWLARQTTLLPEYKQFLEQALRAYEEFAADTGQDEETQVGVAHAFWRVGMIRERLGQRKEAEAAWIRCRDLHVSLAADFPGNPIYRRKLARVYNSLDDLYSFMGQPREAEVASGQALVICRQLAADFPDEPDHRQDLARALNHRGRVLMESGRTGEAEAVVGEALAVLNRLTAEFRAVLAYRRELAQTHMGLGHFLRTARRPREALGHIEQAVAIFQQLVAEFPGPRDHRDSLARGLTNLGSLLGQLDRHQEAENVFRQTLTIQRQLLADFPGVPFYRKGLAMTLGSLGNLFHSVDRPQEAEEPMRQALTIFKQLAADYPKVAEHQNDAAGAMVNLAGLLIDRKDFLAARRLLEDAVPHHQAAMTANQRHPAYRRFYRNNRWKLAETHLALKDHAAAAAAAREFLQAAVEPPGDAYIAAGLLAGCVRLAAQDERLANGRRQELATAYGDSAVAALRQAVEKRAQEVTQMAKDPSLDPLRSRPDFQKLLAELPAKKK